ncbi:MAG: hypothetical protein COT73_04350 [Bdellovibrio sp. CG10_big_fil_rev_8_21_14_0_10_47_8]|nr:MAG: hypothetical protein COT73_04350 [Bdellovibrio sp. CG10_big_fil_rev_8_21_14_0_10_47_8]
MRGFFIRLFYICLMTVGVFSAVWFSASLSGRARSQTPPPAAEPGPPSPQLDPAADTPEAAAPTPSPEAQAPAPENLPSEELAPQEEPLPQVSNVEGYTYDPSGRRDPFLPFSQQGAAPVLDVNSGEPAPIPVAAEPLQMFDLAQIKVVGIVWGVKNPKAMVRDPNGKLYVVRKNSKIGRNNGFVSVIREGALLIVEPIATEGGLQTASTRVMLLNQ